MKANRNLPTVQLADECEWGPAMKALPNDKWRSFVLAMFAVKPGNGQYIAAARMAGFGNPEAVTSKDPNERNRQENALRVTAHRVAHDARTIAAIREEGTKHLQGGSPAAIAALINLVANPFHKDHIRAVGMVLDRTQPVETTHKVEVTHQNKLPSEEEMLRIVKQAREFGLPRAKLEEVFGASLKRLEAKLDGLPVIEAEFEELDDTVPERW